LMIGQLPQEHDRLPHQKPIPLYHKNFD